MPRAHGRNDAEDDMTTNESALNTRQPSPLRYYVPLGIFAALVLLLGFGLTLNPREVPSPLIGKAAPHFELPQLVDAQATFSPRDMAGQVWLLNVWASWCVSCRQEHATLADLAASGAVPVYGLNYKDQREAGLDYLRKLGNPYRAIAYDPQGRVGIDYGVYGTPETYVIDKRGVIRFKRIGPLTPEIVRQKILPLVHELERR
jgi:cytochrome c biogenesis protein CcmG, thiol:disulfide interchange protein DsbE